MGRQANESSGSPGSDVSEETARILFLAYGREAVEMAALRCAELKKTGDRAGLAPLYAVRIEDR